MPPAAGRDGPAEQPLVPLRVPAPRSCLFTASPQALPSRHLAVRSPSVPSSSDEQVWAGWVRLAAVRAAGTPRGNLQLCSLTGTAQPSSLCPRGSPSPPHRAAAADPSPSPVPALLRAKCSEAPAAPCAWGSPSMVPAASGWGGLDGSSCRDCGAGGSTCSPSCPSMAMPGLLMLSLCETGTPSSSASPLRPRRLQS